MTEHRRLDETWAGEFERDGDILTRRLYQPERSGILDAVKTIRNERIVQDVKGSHMLERRWCLSIPFEDWEALRRHPMWCELHSVDNATSQKAWRRFLIHPDSAPFRVRENAC